MSGSTTSCYLEIQGTQDWVIPLLNHSLTNSTKGPDKSVIATVMEPAISTPDLQVGGSEETANLLQVDVVEVENRLTCTPRPNGTMLRNTGAMFTIWYNMK